ncbi:MAG: TolC family protein [Pyrinomonadaceae bacterium]
MMTALSHAKPRAAAALVSVLGLVLAMSITAAAQHSMRSMLTADNSVKKYLDIGTAAGATGSRAGKTVDELVRLAIAGNAELEAMRREAAAGEALVRQARLRANPSLEVRGEREIGGMGDNTFMVEGGVPLELGGRRQARTRVAERELEIRRQAAAERERQIAAEVRTKFGEALAAIYKLMFVEEILTANVQHLNLTAEQVAEGRKAPLEQNIETVEVNRIRALRETGESAVEQRMLELRNVIGLAPEEPLRLAGSFDDLVARPFAVAQAEALERALRTRPDLAGARAVEELAAARRAQARAEGRVDADVMLGWQRMKSGFPQMGMDEATGLLVPIESRSQFFTFGVKLNLPVFNRNQGMVAAAKLEEDAARSRREFGELTIRREVASAYARYDRALRAAEIYRVGVREQAAANLDVIRQTYEIGEKSLLDYIAEHHRFIDTEMGYIDAQLEAYLARVEIMRAANLPELTNK